MNITRTAHATRTRPAATAAALAGLALVLTGCGGEASASADGTYLGTKINNLATLVVEGSTVTYTEMHCGDKPDESEKSVGELNEDRTSITWIETGEFDDTTAVTITENTINVADDDTFISADSDAGKNVRTEWKADCTD